MDPRPVTANSRSRLKLKGIRTATCHLAPCLSYQSAVVSPQGRGEARAGL